MKNKTVSESVLGSSSSSGSINVTILYIHLIVLNPLGQRWSFSMLLKLSPIVIPHLIVVNVLLVPFCLSLSPSPGYNVNGFMNN